MYKTIFFLVRRPEFSPEEFRNRWVNQHLRQVASLPGLCRIRGNTVIDTEAPFAIDAIDAIDAIGEFWWESRDAFEAAVASVDGRRVVADIEAIALSHEHVAVLEHRRRLRQTTADRAHKSGAQRSLSAARSELDEEIT